MKQQDLSRLDGLVREPEGSEPASRDRDGTMPAVPLHSLSPLPFSTLAPSLLPFAASSHRKRDCIHIGCFSKTLEAQRFRALDSLASKARLAQENDREGCSFPTTHSLPPRLLTRARFSITGQLEHIVPWGQNHCHPRGGKCEALRIICML